MVGGHFDSYTLKARWLPAALVTVPVLMLMLSTIELSALLGSVGPATASLLFGVVASEIARSRGRKIERELAGQWGGMPTTRALRAVAGADTEVRRRRLQLEAFTGRKLPGFAEQEADPRGADEAIAQAVRTALALLRSAAEAGTDLLQSENTSYGFRRNLFALKPFGLVVSAVALGIAVSVACVGLLSWLVVVPILLVQVLVTALWVLVARQSWVREQAEVFADRFFTVLDAATTLAAPVAAKPGRS
ncbi:hypothetical protein [Microbacterium testaceum]|uniref:hypothetical protein n=1 Tax=Microbacterium testaceum TaxID=2033 RepID=UPI001D176CF1|nr:hypothetical protein [Microbacterium testaceum]MCC4249669.1 hypothetical protein [Microbacterium testaceum]